MEEDYEVLPNVYTVKGEDHHGINEAMNKCQDHHCKYHYHWKNFAVYSSSLSLLFAAVYSSSNLLTTFAGKTLGFASLAVYALIGFVVTSFVPALVQSCGLRRVLITGIFCFVLFVAGQFYVSYFTLIPAAVFLGLGAAMYWISSMTYMNKLAINYANEFNTSPEKMMSFANGIVMTSYAGGILLGNALSSSILLPSGLDEQSVAIGNESCNLEQNVDEIDPYNKYLMILRGILLLCALIAFIIALIFLDDIEKKNDKEEQSKSILTKVLLELRNSGTKLLSAVRKRPYVLLCFPLTSTVAVVDSFAIGSFPKVSKLSPYILNL